ncbi:MAG: T9SS type A sorting domain-containing protein, partial [candidate division WOR-3 bacterium]
ISVSGILRSRDEGEVRDSFSFFGNIPVGGIRNNLNPFTFFIPEVLEDSLLHFYLSLSASGYSSLLPFEISVSFPTGVADLPNFLLNHKLSLPTILRKGSALKFSLKEGERLEMLLYDITGRKIKKISLERGERQIVLPELPVGIYFLKMKFENWELKKKFIYLK